MIKSFSKAFLIVLYFLLIVSSKTSAQESVSYTELLDLTLEDILNIDISSASNIVESQKESPAITIVITKHEIENRGYKELVDLLYDLPGMDLSITYGDIYVKPYWRGFRTGMPSPFLLMIDGLVLNHLWYNWTDIMTAIPLSNIKQVEIVYGPASSVYGANAFMGVINIITQSDKLTNGISSSAKFSAGSFESKIVDMNVLFKQDDFRLRFSGFMNTGDIDKNSIEGYEYTKEKYLTDRKLWGAFVDNQSIAGVASSKRNNRSLMLNAFYKNTELGFHYFVVDNGWGLNYAFDKIQPVSKWIEPELNLYLRTKHPISENAMFSGLIRYRESDVSNNSTSLEGWGEFGERRNVVFGFWQTINRSYDASFDFELTPMEGIVIKTGVDYKLKDFQRTYEINYGAGIFPDSLQDIDEYDFPVPPGETDKSFNRELIDNEGIYLQTKYKLSKLFDNDVDQYLNFGIRYDRNSFYGVNTTLRAGYILSVGNINMKILYGESYEEPTVRLLFSSWTGSGSNPDLKAMDSRTFELYFEYLNPNYHIAINPYYNKIHNLINELQSTVVNRGSTDIFGFDIHTNVKQTFSGGTLLNLWMFYSFITTEEDKYNADGIELGKGVVGDIAKHKFHFGATLHHGLLSASIIGRYIGSKENEITNPVRRTDSWFTLDTNLRISQFFSEHVSLSLKIYNVFNERYFHPGIRTANAGNTPGFWSDDKWYGSRGWHNSLLPQPGRAFLFSVQVDY